MFYRYKLILNLNRKGYKYKRLGMIFFRKIMVFYFLV